MHDTWTLANETEYIHRIAAPQIEPLCPAFAARQPVERVKAYLAGLSLSHTWDQEERKTLKRTAEAYLRPAVRVKVI